MVVAAEEVTEVKAMEGEGLMVTAAVAAIEVAASMCMRARRGRRRCLWHR